MTTQVSESIAQPKNVAADANAFRKELYKTKMCRSTEMGLPCCYGPECCYAHNASELRTVEQNMTEGVPAAGLSKRGSRLRAQDELRAMASAAIKSASASKQNLAAPKTSALTVPSLPSLPMPPMMMPMMQPAPVMQAPQPSFVYGGMQPMMQLQVVYTTQGPMYVATPTMMQQPQMVYVPAAQPVAPQPSTPVSRYSSATSTPGPSFTDSPPRSPTASAAATPSVVYVSA